MKTCCDRDTQQRITLNERHYVHGNHGKTTLGLVGKQADFITDLIPYYTEFQFAFYTKMYQVFLCRSQGQL